MKHKEYHPLFSLYQEQAEQKNKIVLKPANATKSYHKAHHKIFAAITSAFVILLLILLGPAQAYVINLTGFSNSSPQQGEQVSTTASLEIQNSETLDFNTNITLMLTGPENASCIFSLNGTELAGCIGISIDKLSMTSGSNFGYGYFTNGTFTYNITINTSQFNPGNYTIKLTVATPSLTSDSVPLNILAGEKKVTICHIPPGNAANAHTITVGESAVPAHLKHGDYLGECKPQNQNTNQNNQGNGNNNQGNANSNGNSANIGNQNPNSNGNPNAGGKKK